jgi:hypothetical protein
LKIDQDQHLTKRTRYRDSFTKETAMTNQIETAYCRERMVHVDLRQGFHKCIEENQCLSDDPCPLSGAFHQAPAQMNDAAPVVICSNRPA